MRKFRKQVGVDLAASIEKRAMRENGDTGARQFEAKVVLTVDGWTLNMFVTANQAVRSVSVTGYAVCLPGKP